MNEYKSSAVIPDTSALMKNPNLLENLLTDFKEIIISQTVIRELNYQKDKKQNNAAWLAMTKIEKLQDKLIQRNDTNFRRENNDQKIIALANLYAQEKKIKVFIIHDDVGISLEYKNSILLNDYLSFNKDYIYDEGGAV